MNEKILIIDDDELVRTGLSANLLRAGFEVFTASNVREARACLASTPLDLAVCDLVLGDEDGMDVLRFMQSSYPDISVIIITGHGSVRTALDSLRSGASDYIQKPADPDEVIHRVHMVLDFANLRRTLIQERQKNEERKRMIHDQLNRAERMSSLGALAEGAARDLKEILQPVEALPGEIRKQFDPRDAVHGQLVNLDDALHKAGAVIRDLEAIGKSSNFRMSTLHINDIIDGYLKSADYRQLFGQNPLVKLEVDLMPGLPPVSGSAPHLRQMVANLITNALEAMATGGVLRINTAVRCGDPEAEDALRRKDGDDVVIRVEDTAPRLTEEDIERIFEPFYARNRLGRRQLSGLGLTLVYRVIQEHQGHVEVRAGDQAAGNVFELALPACAEDDSEVLELRPDYTGRERLLLIDDSEAQRSQATRMMQELGYEVTAVPSGRAAVEAIENELENNPGQPPFDLLVIDLVLGDAFDGVETYKAALQLYPGLKAVLASGFADITRIVEARKLGIERTFQKPYTLEALGKNIRYALDD